MTFPRPIAGLLGLLAAGLVLAACGSAASDAPANEPAADTAAGVSDGSAEEVVDDRSVSQDVAGHSYVSTKTTGFDLAPDSTIRLTFVDDGQISLNAGCNNLFGPIEWRADGVAHFAAPMLASTMMACDQALMDQDTFLSGLLADGVDVDVWNTGELILTSGDTGIEFAVDTTAIDDGIADMEQPMPEGEPAYPGD